MLAPRRPAQTSGAGPVQSPMCCTPGDPQLHARSRSNFQAECLVIERPDEAHADHPSASGDAAELDLCMYPRAV
jgi:hypothetical protein